MALLASSVAAIAAPHGALAQTTAPSSITPPTLRPTPQPADGVGVWSSSESLTPPAGSDNLVVQVEAIEVTGGFPELAHDTARITEKLVNRQVTLAELYAGAAAIEAAYARKGFVLVRAVVPPQRLATGGGFRIQIIDGFIESVDVSAVPARVRHRVAVRVASLVGRRHLSLRDIEQPLLLAGDVPGLVLRSTLARGTEAGGARLLLSGRQDMLSGSVSLDNSLASSLGRYEGVAQVSLNSLLGWGEQIYGFAASGYDLPGALRSNTPVRVLGGGMAFAPGTGRASINPELTFSQTQPAPESGAPVTRGLLRRVSLRGGFVLERTRRRSISLNGTIEQIQESDDAVDFATRLSFDRFTVVRAGLTYSGAASSTSFAVVAQLSHGLAGFGSVRGKDLPVGVLPSREGASPDFTKGQIWLHVARPLAKDWQLGLAASAQTGFARPLFRSEQTELEGSEALSAYAGGVTAVDSAVVARAELSKSISIPGKRALRLSPYAFAAAGDGWIARPSAVEVAHTRAFNLGAGARGSIGGRFSLAVEYARGLSNVHRLDRVDRVAFSATIRL